MSLLNILQHEYAPPELNKFNLALHSALTAEPLNEADIQKIISNRANLVESLLNNLDEQQKRQFATLELTSTHAIVDTIDSYRSALKADLAKVSKASKAIKKYHRV